MDRQRIKYTLILFGILDLYSFYHTYENALDFVLTFLWSGQEDMGGYVNLFAMIMVLNGILTLSLIASGFLSITGSRISFLIYYIQFPLRLVFFTLTFGFVLTLLDLHIDSLAYKGLLAIVFGLEILRLIFSIKISRRYLTGKGPVGAL